MKRLLFAFLIGAAFAAASARLLEARSEASALDRVAELEEVVVSKTRELLGYTKYTDYLTLGKKSLSEQAKFLAVQVVREEGLTQVMNKSVIGISSEATVGVWYTAEYSFGYELSPERYDIVRTDSGIEIRLDRPGLVATPAVKSLRHKILSGGVFTDEKAAVIRIYEGAAKRVEAQGLAMASDEAVVALCEKKLVAFLHDFLARQPGVKMVPTITVAYRT